MSKRPILDLPRSVRERLVALAHGRGEEPNLVLTRYAAERPVPPFAHRTSRHG